MNITQEEHRAFTFFLYLISSLVWWIPFGYSNWGILVTISWGWIGIVYVVSMFDKGWMEVRKPIKERGE